MKPRTLICLLLALSGLPFCACSQQIYTYEISWPSNHLEGTFTLSFGSTMNEAYTSTEATGTVIGSNPEIDLTSVRFWAQPYSAELTFFGEQGVGGGEVTAGNLGTYPPVVNGMYVPWTNPSQAWSALLAQGAAEGVSITIIPEPSAKSLLGAALLSAVLFIHTRAAKSKPAKAEQNP